MAVEGRWSWEAELGGGRAVDNSDGGGAVKDGGGSGGGVYSSILA